MKIKSYALAVISLCVFGVSAIAAEPYKMDVDAELKSQFTRLEKDMKNKQIFNRTTSTALRKDSTILASDRDPVDIVARRTRALLDNILKINAVGDLSGYGKKLDRLISKTKSVPVDDKEKRYSLYVRLCSLRRKIAFSNPLIDFKNIMFAKREINPWPYWKGNHMCDQYFGFHAKSGGGIFVLKNALSKSPVLKDLTGNTKCENGRYAGQVLKGGFLSPDLSFDGKDILFSFTEAKKELYKWTEENTFHIFKINADGTNLVQLTDGTENDLHPCFLPNGRIAFMSERRGGFGRCHGRPVPSFTLHTMHEDGSDITLISPHETNEWHPSVDNNGLIVYTRWDYVDRGFNQAHHPWITTPDGRDPRAIQGNYASNAGQRPHMEMQIRAIPGSGKYVFTASGHHTQAYGPIVQMDPSIPDDDKMAMLKRVTPEALFPESEFGVHRGEGMFASPWPLSEDFYLCVYSSTGNDGVSGSKHEDHNYGVYLIDSFGNRELIYRDSSFSALDPIPLRARKKPPVIPHQTLVGLPPVDGKKLPQTPKEELPKMATVGLMNVYNSKFPMPEGTKITSLRIIQLLPKTTPNADNPRIGFGSQKSARAILGTVPVDEDGSAYFEMPVGIPVYFQALNEEGLAVQSMRSAAWVAPGENLTCNGCHEPRNSAPKPMKVFPTALRRTPSKIKPDVAGTKPFSFPILVQPILDEKCAGCHTANIKKGNKKCPDLRIDGDVQTIVRKERNGTERIVSKYPHDRNWPSSYRNLREYAFFWDHPVFTTPRTTPGKFGAIQSRLYNMLKKGHHDVKLNNEQMHRITLWLDSNSDFYGSYDNTEQQAAGKVVPPTME